MMEIAMRQSAEDMGCHVEDFKADKNVVVPINLGKKARKYLKEPITCNLVSYGNNIMVASINETLDTGDDGSGVCVCRQIRILPLF